MGDMTRHVMVLLMDMAVKNRHIGLLHENFCRLRAVRSCPVPLRIEIKQRPMSKHDDFRVRFLLF